MERAGVSGRKSGSVPDFVFHFITRDFCENLPAAPFRSNRNSCLCPFSCPPSRNSNQSDSAYNDRYNKTLRLEEKPSRYRRFRNSIHIVLLFLLPPIHFRFREVRASPVEILAYPFPFLFRQLIFHFFESFFLLFQHFPVFWYPACRFCETAEIFLRGLINKDLRGRKRRQAKSY